MTLSYTIGNSRKDSFFALFSPPKIIWSCSKPYLLGVNNLEA